MMVVLVFPLILMELLIFMVVEEVVRRIQDILVMMVVMVAAVRVVPEATQVDQEEILVEIVMV
jgi:hypothetical protein